ncbi:hypothetical protein HMPREF9607_01707 [Cutibacterium modestum HL044PA1]|uniref:Uncharacterized protein n=1 Tax=Cutibacterium modestum HL044PA1 TaxID=765109 RepID=A0ABP2KB80_9ACTN|nr:hypothetical protein HMPREF9607_01707 [Cutibacterium modestum HL044PA1]
MPKVVVGRADFRQLFSVLWITPVTVLNQPVENHLVTPAPTTGNGSGTDYYPDHHTEAGERGGCVSSGKW